MTTTLSPQHRIQSIGNRFTTDVTVATRAPTIHEARFEIERGGLRYMIELVFYGDYADQQISTRVSRVHNQEPWLTTLLSVAYLDDDLLVQLIEQTLNHNQWR